MSHTGYWLIDFIIVSFHFWPLFRSTVKRHQKASKLLLQISIFRVQTFGLLYWTFAQLVGVSFPHYCPCLKVFFYPYWAMVQSLRTQILDLNLSQLKERSLRTQHWSELLRTQQMILAVFKVFQVGGHEVSPQLMFKFFRQSMFVYWLLVVVLGFSNFSAMSNQVQVTVRKLGNCLPSITLFSSCALGLYHSVMFQISFCQDKMAEN